MPIDAKIKNLVIANLKTQLRSRADAFANQQLNKAIESKDLELVATEYNKFYDPANPEGYKKYGLPEVKALNFDASIPRTELFANYVSAKELLARKSIPQYAQPKMDEIAKMKLSNQFALSRSLTLKNAEKASKELNIYSPQGEIEDIANTPIGQDARAKAISFTNDYNSRFSGEKIYPFVAAEATAFKGTPYETALGIVTSNIKGADKFIITSSDNPAEVKNKSSSLAALINIENKKYGVPPVAAQDITEGKVFIKEAFGADGKSTVIAYPIRNKQAVTELSNGVILAQMTPEQKRQYVQGGFKGAGATQKQPTQPQSKSIKQSDIAAKAKASGYTPSEYEALLRKKGINIIK